MKIKPLAVAGFGLFACASLGVIPAQKALGQSDADYDRMLCQRAPVNSFAAMIVSDRGVDCTRYGISAPINQGIQSEGARNSAMLRCSAAGGNWRNDIGMCMPSTEYGCRRQGLEWSYQYKECFPPRR